MRHYHDRAAAAVILRRVVATLAARVRRGGPAIVSHQGRQAFPVEVVDAVDQGPLPDPASIQSHRRPGRESVPSVLWPLSRVGHAHDPRIEASDGLHEIGLGGHHLLDVLVGARVLVDAGG
jgi:hypothetical protein